jgi:DNA-binding PadR family transcriptional regulator
MASRRAIVSAVDVEVLAAIREASGIESYGYEISRLCGRGHGSIYRSLDRLHVLGLVERRSEPADIAAREGRPARVLYSLTETGLALLATWRRATLDRSPTARYLA